MSDGVDVRKLLDAYDAVSKKYLYEAVSKHLARSRPDIFVDVVNELTKYKDIADELMSDTEEKLKPVDDLIRQGERIAAIKLLRDIQPGTGLKDAKDLVDARREKINKYA